MRELKGIFINLVLMAGVMYGLVGYEASVFDSYGVAYEDLSHIQAVNEVNATLSEMKEDIDSAQVTGTFLDIPLMVASGVYSAVKVTFVLTDIVTDIPVDIANVAGVGGFVPSWIGDVLLGVISVVVLFAIIESVTRVEL